MSVIDPAFEGVGQEEGIDIWRIEDFQVKPVPKQEYGNFYNGDSYIVLKTSQTKSGRLEWNIHFWIGEESSQDESGTAAIKSVELDELLGGSPVQYREVQNHESSLFLSYFKRGLRYLQGGVKSGFYHVVDEHVTRLLRVKGRRHVRLHEMPLNISSMNTGDCFILDSSSTVFVFVGTESGRMERIKAIQAANSIRDDIHCGRSVVKIIDSNSTHDEVSEFFKELGGGSVSDISEPAAGGDDLTYEANFESQVGLYRVSEHEGGDLKVELIAHQPLKQEYLENDQDCFILDGGKNGLFVWIGKDSSRKERVEAMNFANKYVEKKGYPKWLSVQRIVHEAETPEFKSYFTTWKEPEDQVGLGRVYAKEEIAVPNKEVSVFAGKSSNKVTDRSYTTVAVKKDLCGISAKSKMSIGNGIEMQSEECSLRVTILKKQLEIEKERLKLNEELHKLQMEFERQKLQHLKKLHHLKMLHTNILMKTIVNELLKPF